MLVAVLADTHLPRGTRALPARCVAQMRSADLIVHAGDFVGPDVLDQIESLGPPVVAVHGNMDVPELRRRLPETASFEAAGVTVGVLHDAGPAAGRFERMRRRFPEASAVVFGHSHLPLHERAEGFQVFNPGSPTERRRAPRHTMGIARADAGAISFELVALD